MTKQVWVVVVAVVLVLTAASFGYGFHRDELYFLAAGRHLAWGYPDQPPLTPLLARLADLVAPGSLWALRVPATLASAGTAYLVARTAKEMGATARGQLLAAVTTAVSGFVLVFGHMLYTVTTDLFFSALVIWLTARLIRTRDQRLLAVLGAAIGLGLLNKTLLALLAAAVLVGLLVAGPREVLRGRWLAVGVGIAVLLWLPNLVWQAQNGWPQLDMVGLLSEEANLGGRAGFVPFQFLLLGPLLAPVWLAGLYVLLRYQDFRAFGVAYLVMAALLLVGGGAAYYLVGAYPALIAAGAAVVDQRLSRTWQTVAVAAVAAFSAVFNALLGLPIVPVEHLAETPITDIYHEAGEQVGWPRLADTVAEVHRGLTPDERARAVVVTSNYGQAGAVLVYGPARGLPAVYSGQNAYGYWEIPPDTADVAIVVGDGAWTSACEQLTDAAVIDNGHGIDNDEQGTPVRVCRGLDKSWSELWPSIRRLS
ncbi:MAG: glycosyltransferase family 39 protein [Umezawaea sp.]